MEGDLYECPACYRIARWTDGAYADESTSGEDEFWCQTCGAETPIGLCRRMETG